MKMEMLTGIIDKNNGWVSNIFENCFQYRTRYSSGKGLTYSNSVMFRFLTALEKKVFTISEFLASCVKFLLPSTSMTFSEDFASSENKKLNSFPKAFIINNIPFVWISIVITFCFSSNKYATIVLFSISSFVSLKFVFQKTITKTSLPYVSHRECFVHERDIIYLSALLFSWRKPVQICRCFFQTVTIST